MNLYRTDLHIHTGTSPCGDLEMSPLLIVEKSIEKGLHIIGIADHNCTKQAPVVNSIGNRKSLFVLMGAELRTQEDINCLAFVPDIYKLNELQAFIDRNRTLVVNNPKVFGYQYVVDEDDNIIEDIPDLLTIPLKVNIFEISRFVKMLGGILILSRIDRYEYSIIGKLGHIPEELEFDAVEISKSLNKEVLIADYPILKDKTFINSSDSHFPDTIGDTSTIFQIKEPSFDEIKKALHNIDGRKVIT